MEHLSDFIGIRNNSRVHGKNKQFYGYDPMKAITKKYNKNANWNLHYMNATRTTQMLP